MTDLRSFDPIWESKYAAGHAQRYPWDCVVSFVFRNTPRDKPREKIRILEIGCGTGSNLWFAAREGFQVAGVDASASAIASAKKRFTDDGLEGDFQVSDFTSLPFADNSFDLAIDRSAIVCRGMEAGREAVRGVRRVLRPGGKFFFNPYSDRHSSFVASSPGPDGLRIDISAGTLINAGQLCFYGRQQVEDVLSENWCICSMQHFELVEMAEPSYLVHAEWRVVAEKLK